MPLKTRVERLEEKRGIAVGKPIVMAFVNEEEDAEPAKEAARKAEGYEPGECEFIVVRFVDPKPRESQPC